MSEEDIVTGPRLVPSPFQKGVNTLYDRNFIPTKDFRVGVAVPVISDAEVIELDPKETVSADADQLPLFGEEEARSSHPTAPTSSEISDSPVTSEEEFNHILQQINGQKAGSADVKVTVPADSKIPAAAPSTSATKKATTEAPLPPESTDFFDDSEGVQTNKSPIEMKVVKPRR